MSSNQKMHSYGKPTLPLSGSGRTGAADSAPQRVTRVHDRFEPALTEDARNRHSEQTLSDSETPGETSASRPSRRFIYGGRVRRRSKELQRRTWLKVWS
jgi:hypothetical protein